MYGPNDKIASPRLGKIQFQIPRTIVNKRMKKKEQKRGEWELLGERPKTKARIMKRTGETSDDVVDTYHT